MIDPKMMEDMGWSPISARAWSLQQAVIKDEDERLAQGLDYSERHARLAIVHARQDLVLMHSVLEDCAVSLRRAARLQFAIAALLFALIALVFVK